MLSAQLTEPPCTHRMQRINSIPCHSVPWIQTSHVLAKYGRPGCTKSSSKKMGDAADVGRDVLWTVYGKIAEFDVLRSGATFRGWLRTITRNKIGDFLPLTWQAFWLSTMEDVPAAEIADRLGMSPTAVRQAKFQVLRRLRDEMGMATEVTSSTQSL